VSSMPQPTPPDQDATAIGELILGVDTHKDVHVAAVITVLGRLVASRSFLTTAAGYRRLLEWAGSFGTLRRAGVECTGSYGAALARHLQAAGIEVVEVNQPDKATRRRLGKSDPIDAQAAAQAVLSGRATATAKTGDGPVEMLRMFKLAKGSAIKSRTQAINQLKAVLVAADPALREALSGLSTPILIRRCTQLPLQAGLPTDPASAAAYTLRLLAGRIVALTAEIHDSSRRSPARSTSRRPSCSPGAASVPTARRRCSSPLATTPTAWAARPPTPPCAAPARSRRPPARPNVCASTVAGTGRPTLPCIASRCRACAGTNAPATTSPAASARARPAVRPSAA
jgi:transposase